jgi:ribosomal protein S18 acetylase RimI-like enzyme
MASEISLRPFTQDDLEFLFRVYASSREEELAVVPWSDEEKEAFLRQQFNAQHTYYQEHFADARYDVILKGDTPIGRLYVDRQPDEIRVIDIALLAEHRGGGIGSGFVREIMDEAGATGKAVRLHVEKNNPAKRLYFRLGFRDIEDVGVYDLMEWTRDGQAREPSSESE